MLSLLKSVHRNTAQWLYSSRCPHQSQFRYLDGVDVRIPSKENRSFKDDLDRVACRPRFWLGLGSRVYGTLSFRCLDFKCCFWTGRTGSVEEPAPLLASTRGATASTSSARAPGKRLYFSATWTLIWAAGSREHDDHALVHPS